jgi:hypothetical protein
MRGRAQTGTADFMGLIGNKPMPAVDEQLLPKCSGDGMCTRS